MAEQSPQSVLLELSQILEEKAYALKSSSNATSWRRRAISSGTTSTTTTSATSDDEANDILQRANKLQKTLKSKPKVPENDSVLIAVCEMKEGRRGVFGRAKCPFVEMEARKSDSYSMFARRAALKCRMSEQAGKVLSLFKLNGARVLDECMTIKGKLKPWTLGNYLLLMKKSPSTVKLGVGFIAPLQSESSSDGDEQNPFHHRCLNRGKNVNKSPKSSDSSDNDVDDVKRTKRTDDEKPNGHVTDPYIESDEIMPPPTTTEHKINAPGDDDMDMGSSSSTKVLPVNIRETYSVLEFFEDDIQKATNDYSPDLVIGSGGFGVVYKANLRGTTVAIKKLTEDGAIALAAGQHGKLPESFSVAGQLQCEMKTLSECRNRNLVDLVGFCFRPAMLVYEFMEQGNLADRLFDMTHPPLTWSERSRILKDVCRGLTWLHGSKRIHGDIKAANVLLDRHLTAKIGDFGFSRELPELVEGRTMISAVVVAKSLGYSPPEVDSSHISTKSDVYSYGIVALETFTGQVAYSKDRQDQKLIEHLDEERKSVAGYRTIADPRAGSELAPYLVNLYFKIIEHCLLKHSKRPESDKVMQWWEETNF